MEGDSAVGLSGRLVGGVVGSGVVSGTQESAVVEVGAAPVGPADPVVCVAEPGWPVASFGHAALVADAEGGELGSGEEPSGAADVEDLTVAVEDDRDDAGGAREPAGLAGADLLAGVEDTGLLGLAGQGVEVDGD